MLPGEKAQVSLTVFIDDDVAAQMNMGSTRLEETLVIHTALGRDHFVAIGGEYGTTNSASISHEARPDRRTQSAHVSRQASLGLSDYPDLSGS